MTNEDDSDFECAIRLFQEFGKFFESPFLTSDEKDELAQSVLQVLLGE